MTQSKIEFNLVHVGGDVWEVYFEGKKLLTGSAASCKDLLEAFAEVSRRSSRPIRDKNFTAPLRTTQSAHGTHAQTSDDTRRRR